MGVRTRGVLCLTNHISSLPLEGCGNERPADSQVCNNGPCENRIEWFTGPWSQVWGWREVALGLRGRCLEQINVCDFTVTGFVVMCNWIHMVCVCYCVWLSALQSAAQAASRGQWCVWWRQTKDSPSCRPTSARLWTGLSASRAATSRPVEQSGITPTGVLWVRYGALVLFVHYMPSSKPSSLYGSHLQI